MADASVCSVISCRLAKKTGEVVEYKHPVGDNNNRKNKVVVESLRKLQSEINNCLSEIIDKEKMGNLGKEQVESSGIGHEDDLESDEEDDDDDDGDDDFENKNGQRLGNLQPPSKRPRS